MLRKDIAKAPDLLCTTAKEVAHRIAKYKSSGNAIDYLIANKAINDTRRHLLDVKLLLNSMRGPAARR
jgi:hypothetical protein